MSQFPTAAEIATRALERVGVFPSSDQGPDPVQMDRALRRFDAILAEKGGSTRLWFLARATASFTLPPTVAEFDLINQAGGQIAVDDFQFVIGASVRVSTNAEDQPLQLIGRRDYEALEQKAQAGTPSQIYINRTIRKPRAAVWPVPSASGPTITLRLVYEGFFADMAAKKGVVETGLDAAWSRWAEHELAADIGTGPVVTLPKWRSDGYRVTAKAAWDKLEAFAAGQQIYPRRVKMWGA